jgi:PqqD family protein of HPr-rel-A system
MPAETRYRAAAAEALAIVPLDALTAVYDRRSGQTHLLASPLPEILAAIGEGEPTLSAIVAALSAEFDFTPNAPAEAGAVDASAAGEPQSSGLRRSTAQISEAIAARLDELVALGLVAAR